MSDEELQQQVLVQTSKGVIRNYMQQWDVAVDEGTIDGQLRIGRAIIDELHRLKTLGGL